MFKLLDGITALKAGLTVEDQQAFAKLALGQSPDVTFFGCSDSRLEPIVSASKEPGSVFVNRNIGNLIPPNGATVATPESASTLAVIEYALTQLNVSYIIVCGHSGCGAMQALWNSTSFPEAPHLEAWLEHGRKSLERLKQEPGVVLDKELSPQNQLSQVNVLQQLDHLQCHPLVSKRLEAGALQLYGWWFEIATASVHSFDEETRSFLLIEEEHAARIRKRAATVRKHA